MRVSNLERVMSKEEITEDIKNLKSTMQNIIKYNEKYHPERTFDLSDVIQYALPYSEHISPYRARAEYIALMIQEVLVKPDPFSLLEAWRKHETKNAPEHSYYESWMEEHFMLKKIRNDPDGVLQELKEKGVFIE